MSRNLASVFETNIQDDLRCAKCAYNLRTRPLKGVCPECGNTYDAHVVGRHGILDADARDFPLGVLLGEFALAAMYIPLISLGLKQQVWPVVFIGGGFLVAGVVLLPNLLRRLRKWNQIRHLPPTEAHVSRRQRRIAPSLLMEQDAPISRNTYCAGCLLNLKGQPVSGACLQCEAEYDARPHQMKNVLRREDAVLPRLHIWLLILAIETSMSLLCLAFRFEHPLWYAATGLSLAAPVAAGVYFVRAWRLYQRLLADA